MQFVLIKLPHYPRLLEDDHLDRMKPVRYKQIRDAIKKLRDEKAEPLYVDHRTFNEIEEKLKPAVRFCNKELDDCGVENLLLSHFIMLMNDIFTARDLQTS